MHDVMISICVGCLCRYQAARCCARYGALAVSLGTICVKLFVDWETSPQSLLLVMDDCGQQEMHLLVVDDYRERMRCHARVYSWFARFWTQGFMFWNGHMWHPAGQFEVQNTD